MKIIIVDDDCLVAGALKTILEVKYNHFLLTYVRDILRSCNQSELSASKYCMARRIGLRYSEFY